MPPNMKRLFSSWYDSVKQRQEFEVAESARQMCENSYTFTLRLHSIVAEEMAVTDSQFLDGCFFRRFAPGRFQSQFSRDKKDGPVPLRIMSRTGDLEQDLVGLFVRPGDEYCRDVALSSLSTEKSQHLQNEAPKVPTNRVRMGKDVARLMDDILGKSEGTELLEWIREWKAAGLAMEKWADSKKRQKGIYVGEFSPGQLETDTPERSLAEMMQVEQSNRNSIHRHYIELLAANPRNEKLKRFYECYNYMYNRALAAQHSDWVENSAPGIPLLTRAWDDLWRQDIRQPADLFPDKFATFLAEADGDTYRDWLREGSSHMRNYWDTGEERHLRQAIEPLANAAVTAKYKYHALWGAVVRYTGASVGFIAGAVMSKGWDVVLSGATALTLSQIGADLGKAFWTSFASPEASIRRSIIEYSRRVVR